MTRLDFGTTTRCLGFLPFAAPVPKQVSVHLCVKKGIRILLVPLNETFLFPCSLIRILRDPDRRVKSQKVSILDSWLIPSQRSIYVE